ncbi:MAG: tRNA lysidine(34) synthetase TilS [Mailhella sp.]|nr:tRNA lysidine(34) synthetase TilS [Mailhella sp.]
MPLSPSLSLNDLAPKDARMALETVRFAEEELQLAGKSGLHGARLLVAFSGGADSTALLVLACALRSQLGMDIHAAHLDHGLREESRAEAEFARAFCESLGVPFHTKREDVNVLAGEWGCGIEEAGRRARYAFLEECREDIGASWVLTAHHSGDLAEDVIMRLTRGAAWPGLGGMRAVVEEAPAPHRAGRRILRPLLMLDKNQLTGMLERLGVEWVEDSSNQSREWKRNRVRNDIMPLLLAENPSFNESVRRLWRNAREDERWWESRLEAALEVQGEGEERRIRISAAALDGLSRMGRMRVMTEAVKRMERGQARADTLENMDDAWQYRRFPRRFSFAGWLKAEVTARGILFFLAPGR